VDVCGVDVINLSLGWSSFFSTDVRDALQYAADHGVISVAAAGNNSGDASSFYPCAYGPGHPLSTAEIVMCVSATGSSDNFASFSNFGNPVDISAPGVSILSTIPGNSYGYKQGTSMATPHVAAVVALVMSQFPSYTRDQVWNYVLAGAEDRGAVGWDAKYGWGRLNAYRTLSAVTTTITNTMTEVSTLYTPGTTTATSTSYTSTATSTSTIPAVTTVVLVPLSMTSTVQSTQFLTSFVTTTVTSYTSTQSSTSTIVVYTTVTVLGAAAASSSPLAYFGFISLLAAMVGHRVTASKGRRIPRVESRIGRRCSTS
jgi:subtilisin family serine protease